MITVQPIVYTTNPEAWHRLALDLGLTPVEEPGWAWSEFAGDGVLAVHGVAEGDPSAGTCDLHLLVADLDAAEAASAGLALATRTVLDDIGPLLTLTGEDFRITLTEGVRDATDGELAVMPLHYAEDLTGPRQVLVALGLRPRIASDAGTWLDLTADHGGLVGLHRGSAPVEPAFEHAGDLDALADRLRSVGWSARVIDEAYNRTLLVAGPEGRDVWINGAQTDLYGYHRLDGDA